MDELFNGTKGDLPTKAKLLAEYAHQTLMNHRRKYDDTPYINHPIEVAEMVKEFGGSDVMIAAAYLHDTLEDTPLDPKLIFNLDGTGEVLNLVLELTDISKLEDGNRTIRKAIDREHLSNASKDAQNIKVCDCIHNAHNIQEFDMKFAKIYREEIRLLIPILDKADINLINELTNILKGN